MSSSDLTERVSTMDKKVSIRNRRDWLKTAGTTGAVGSLISVLPAQWTKPVLNSLLLPAHAMTSACGVFVEQPVSDVINFVVTSTEVQGPITLPLLTSTTFSGTQSSVLGTCSNGEPQRQEVSFAGTIDSANNQTTGTLSIDIFCGSLLVCQQRTRYVATQTPLMVGVDTGSYQGALTGTFSCCEQSMGLLRVAATQGLEGLSLLR